MDAIREVIATLYLAAAYAGGPRWVEKANELLDECANDPETGCEAARMLRILSEQSRNLFADAPSLAPSIFAADPPHALSLLLA